MSHLRRNKTIKGNLDAFATCSIRTSISEAVNKAGSASQATECTYVTGFHHFPQESTRNSCLDSSARNCAENPSTSTQIFVSTYAGKLRNSSEKYKLSVSRTVRRSVGAKHLRIAHRIFAKVTRAKLLCNCRAEEQSGLMSQVSVAQQPESWLPNQIAVLPIRWRYNELVFAITCAVSIPGILMYSVVRRRVRVYIFERHLSVAYVGDAKPEGAEWTKIREASYQLVDVRPKVLLTNTNWQACSMHSSTQLTKPCSTCAMKPFIA